MSRASLAAFGLLFLAGATRAQGLELDARGGAVPGPLEFELSGGTPGAAFVLLFAPREAPTLLPGGLVLDVPLDWARTTQRLGLTGNLDGAGRAALGLPLPDWSALVGRTLSFQAVSGPPLGASNLLRVTPARSGTFTATLEAPLFPVLGGALVPLDDARQLVIGGSGPLAQIYDARREEFTAGGASFGVGLLAQTTALADGRVLFTGGLAASGQPTELAALFDPRSGATRFLRMGAPRAGHGASLLGNGKVLVTGGFAALDLSDPLALLAGIQRSTELFDPLTESFVAGPDLLEARALHSSTTLASGGALIAGGLSLVPFVNLPTVSSTAYEYSTSSGNFGFPRFLGRARLLHSAVRLTSGKVLVVGGLGLDFTAFLASGDLADLAVTTHADAELYTAGLFGSFQGAGTLAAGRAGAGLVALPGNRALVAGGLELAFSAGGAPLFTLLASAEVHDGAGFQSTGSMAAARALPLTTLLGDGSVLVLGGGGAAEVWQP